MAQTPVIVRAHGEAIDYTPSSDVAVGAVVVQGTLVGIAERPIAANVKGSLRIRCVADVPKDSSNLSSVGTAIYWDADGNPVGGTAGSGAFTSTATGNTFAGWNLETAGAGVGTVEAIILSSFAVSVTTTDDLTDVGTVGYAAGSLLVGDGSKFENVAVSGPFNLSAAGLVSVDSATVAALGTVQGDAAAIADGFTLVSGADAAKGVKLPTAAAGGLCIVKNNANAVLKVWPNTADAINALGANASLSMAAYTSAIFVAYDATTWYTIPLLPS